MQWGRTTRERELRRAERNLESYFAWLPLELANGKWLWLQKYWSMPGYSGRGVCYATAEERNEALK